MAAFVALISASISAEKESTLPSVATGAAGAGDSDPAESAGVLSVADKGIGADAESIVK